MAVIDIESRRPIRAGATRRGIIGSGRFAKHHAPMAARTRAGGLFGMLMLWRDRIRYRAELRRELLPQPDSVLEDAGMTREEAQREAFKPFWRA